jgi:cyanophycin synthetase
VLRAEAAGSVVRLDSRRFIDGCWAGLPERTAIVDFAVSDVGIDAAAEEWLRNGAIGLCPEEPLIGIAASDWPGGLLLASPDSVAVGPAGAERVAAWLAAITVAIQRWGREPVSRGRVVTVEPGRVQVAVPWYRAQFLDQALEVAVSVVNQCVQPSLQVPSAVLNWLGGTDGAQRVRTLRQRFGNDWQTIQNNGLSPYTLRIAQSAAALGMPVDVLPSYVQIGWGAGAQRFDMTFTRDTSWIASGVAKNKMKCNRTLSAEGVPVPKATMVGTIEQAERAAEALGWPVVVKPFNQDQGLGVTARIKDGATLRRAFDEAAWYSPGNVIIEQHIDGDDYRLLVVHGQTLQVVRRTAAGVIGDGVHTVNELMDAVNSHPWRGKDPFSRLKLLVLDELALGCLEQQGLRPGSIPEPGRSVWLRRIANVSSGGTAEDVTEITHPDNRALAERAARIVGLDVAGMDLLITDISRSWRDVGGAICEVNSQPGFRVHWLANPDRDLEGEMLQILFGDRSPRIPTAAVIGAGQAAQAARELQEAWTAAGTAAGLCTTDGVLIGSSVVSSEDLTGLRGVRALLIDPGVQAGVFELPVDRLLREGHPCDGYDVLAVLDSADVAEADAVQRARVALVLNADDPGCLALRSLTSGRVVLVTADPGQPAVAEHRRADGDVVFTAADGSIIGASGERETVLRAGPDTPTSRYAAAMAWALGLIG